MAKNKTPKNTKVWYILGGIALVAIAAVAVTFAPSESQQGFIRTSKGGDRLSSSKYDVCVEKCVAENGARSQGRCEEKCKAELTPVPEEEAVVKVTVDTAPDGYSYLVGQTGQILAFTIEPSEPVTFDRANFVIEGSNGADTFDIQNFGMKCLTAGNLIADPVVSLSRTVSVGNLDYAITGNRLGCFATVDFVGGSGGSIQSSLSFEDLWKFYDADGNEVRVEFINAEGSIVNIEGSTGNVDGDEAQVVVKVNGPGETANYEVGQTGQILAFTIEPSEPVTFDRANFVIEGSNGADTFDIQNFGMKCLTAGNLIADPVVSLSRTVSVGNLDYAITGNRLGCFVTVDFVDGEGGSIQTSLSFENLWKFYDAQGNEAVVTFENSEGPLVNILPGLGE